MESTSVRNALHGCEVLNGGIPRNGEMTVKQNRKALKSFAVLVDNKDKYCMGHWHISVSTSFCRPGGWTTSVSALVVATAAWTP